MGLPGRLLYLRSHLRPRAGHQAARPSSLLRIQNTISRFSTDACEREVVGSSFGQQTNRIQPLHRIAIEGDFRTSNDPYASYCPTPSITAIYHCRTDACVTLGYKR